MFEAFSGLQHVVPIGSQSFIGPGPLLHFKLCLYFVNRDNFQMLCLSCYFKLMSLVLQDFPVPVLSLRLKYKHAPNLFVLCLLGFFPHLRVHVLEALGKFRTDTFFTCDDG